MNPGKRKEFEKQWQGNLAKRFLAVFPTMDYYLATCSAADFSTTLALGQLLTLTDVNTEPVEADALGWAEHFLMALEDTANIERETWWYLSWAEPADQDEDPVSGWRGAALIEADNEDEAYVRAHELDIAPHLAHIHPNVFGPMMMSIIEIWRDTGRENLLERLLTPEELTEHMYGGMVWVETEVEIENGDDRG